MKSKKIKALMLITLLCAFTLSGCHRNEEYAVKGSDGFFADGTIPADAKIYPIIDDIFPMKVTGDAQDDIKPDDIWVINHYVDLFCSFDDTEGDGIKADEIGKFLTSYTVDAIIKENEAAGSHHKIVGVQVLQIEAHDVDSVEVLYWKRGVSHGNDGNKISLDTVSALFFKRATDGQWYEDGIAHVLTEVTGAFTCVRDISTGGISIVKT